MIKYNSIVTVFYDSDKMIAVTTASIILSFIQ